MTDDTSNGSISNGLTQTLLTGTPGSFDAADSTEDDILSVGLFRELIYLLLPPEVCSFTVNPINIHFTWYSSIILLKLLYILSLIPRLGITSRKLSGHGSVARAVEMASPSMG